MNESLSRQLLDPAWVRSNQFAALAEISRTLQTNEDAGRELVIRALENRDAFSECQPILSSLIQAAGLYPYVAVDEPLATGDLLNLEFHTAEGLQGIVLHSMQGKVYRALMDGANVILSAPTSFGKSLLIDAAIASGKYACVVVIVPTIALIDETRRRFSARFGREFKVITHATQKATGKDIYVFTQERYIEAVETLQPDFFVVDEFYKLSPERGDDRTFTLNHAFYRLLKSGAQFFLIGPNVRAITIDQTHLNFRFFGTDFTTVATEVTFSTDDDADKQAIDIARRMDAPTLVFCKSAASAYKLAHALREAGISAPCAEAKGFASWLRDNYHTDWILPDLLEDGLAVHHGSLPRSVAYHILRLFNAGAIRFLLCTSTIIEGVNTSAKSIIIYDNKIATKKFDQFTFNNIKGRAGRMFKHFIGHVYVLQKEPDPELPLVDVPSITQPESVPESLLVQLDERDLSEHSLERLRYLHAQDDLPIAVIRANSGIAPEYQLTLAQKIASDPHTFHPLLSWHAFPKSNQLLATCQLIFEFLMGGTGKDGVLSAKHLYYRMSRFGQLRSVKSLIRAECDESTPPKNPTEATEAVLSFLRKWCEFHFPRYLAALDKIQRSVFTRYGLKPGNYEVYGTTVTRLFMPLSATVLEEYGVPYQLTSRIEKSYPLGEDVDAILASLATIDTSGLQLSPFERDVLSDALANL